MLAYEFEIIDVGTCIRKDIMNYACQMIRYMSRPFPKPTRLNL